MSVALNLGKFPAWAGPNDAWTEADQSLETWLTAMATFRHRQVLAEALTPTVQQMPEARKERPYPKAPPRPPRPQHVAEHLPTDTDTFTDQQIRTAERLLGINKETA